MSSPLTFLFYGRSGAGKGTQARLLETYLKEHTGRDVLYVETGNGLRDLAAKKDKYFTGVLTEQTLSEGGLFPEFLPIWVWANALVKQYSGEEHLILDGLARRKDEVPVLDSAMEFYHISNPYIFHINVSRERAFEMLKGRGRPDDTDDSINERLDWFEENVHHAMDAFRDLPRYNFIDINGEQTIEEVHNEIIASIKELE
ncbi:MAG: nucleoside monophosphate kinase [Parcubacteria group bacterium]|nr:nucleoside monophosphate kinase [Parcubacteria group bacterium]